MAYKLKYIFNLYHICSTYRILYSIKNIKESVVYKSMRIKTNILPAVRISDVLRIKAEKKAESLGMNLSEYIRYLIQKDIEESFK